MYRLPDITPPQNRARFGRTREYVIIRPNILTEHPTEVLNREPRELILGECRDNRTPSGGRSPGSFIERPDGAEGELRLGVEIDEVMGYEGYNFKTRFEDVSVELKALGQRPRASQGQEEFADAPVMEFEADGSVQEGVLVNHQSMILNSSPAEIAIGNSELNETSVVERFRHKTSNSPSRGLQLQNLPASVEGEGGERRLLSWAFGPWA
ncbi:hypothetical protein CRG98_036655 [Punica granatum]|uniref:Uncharacterized protein n=1 Tax=Punica granatum TaxID=22663 RepID=A0A2I0IFT7_PUNGR|nr:hypothetical protein CRG98_036655 [Punica granatum]